MAHHRTSPGSTLKPQLFLPLAESNALLALSGSESTPPRAPVASDATGELHKIASGFRKWTSTRTEGFPKMPVEKQLYSAFRDLVLIVMHCLRGIVLEPPEGCCLLLPYSKGSDFKPVDSNETDKLDQVLVVRAWDSSVAGVAQPKYADTFAVVEVKRVEKVSFDGSSRAVRDGGAVLQKARQQLVRYNRQVYEHQHNRMLAWGLTVCDSLVRTCLFGPDRVLSSGDIDVATPDGRSVLVGLLVNLCLCEENRRGYIPTIRQHENAGGRYWTIRCNRISSSGEQEPEMATFYSRGPTMAADRNFGRHTRGFPVAERLEDIDSPMLFAKVAWHYVEGGAASEQHSELLHRDISTSTILVVHSPLAGTVHGVLVDFDCAISVGVDRKARPERTGTLPFMSVLNLEANWRERTELDDWESLLYLVCWLATFGINKEDRKSPPVPVYSRTHH
ncbi:hypothetical protein GQ54DRAFT_306984 [Martensiomyces pterosporus]|nr:hypothetical protein GQ54DRAFT_306984 [Martensiomyces pterosporus]